MASTPTAVDRAAATPKVLENILLHSTPLTVLRAQATCRKVNALIHSSPALQQKLFLKPDFESCSHPFDVAPNELLSALARNPAEYHFALAHPRGPRPIIPVDAAGGTHSIAVKLSAVPEPGSCVAMFVTQPPMKRLDLFCHHPTPARGNPRLDRMMVPYGRVVSPSGVTWGDVCKELVKKGLKMGSKIERAAKMAGSPY